MCVFLSFLLGCCGHKCRQIFGNSSSSQISGTCDSQACCCCGDLKMGAQCVSSFDDVLNSAGYSYTCFLIVGFIGLLVTTVVYIGIYVTVKSHKNQIQAQQVQEGAQNGEMANFASLIKSTNGIFYVYLVFLICYFPFFISLVVFVMNDPTISLKRFHLFSWTLVYLNSTLNPVIYCWKMRHIRHAIIDILRNMSWFRNRGTH